MGSLINENDVSFKQRCIASFLCYTRDPKIKELDVKQLQKLSARLWENAKVLLKGKVRKTDVVFTQQDVNFVTDFWSEYFIRSGDKYRFIEKGFSVGRQLVFDKIFFTGRFEMEPKCVKQTWRDVFQENSIKNK